MARKILVADDEEKLRIVIKERLEHAGYDVEMAVDGKDALHKVKKFNPDVIVLDVMMPELDGFQVLEHLKKDKHTMHIPVIMLTALNQSDNVQKGMEHLAHRYITKPFNSQDFLHEIDRCFTEIGDSSAGD
ncbi:MAG: response regulator [Candidatus Omnitrophota bacterium]|nr:response regulator [Candidatus Omnitrophota bacterium]